MNRSIRISRRTFLKISATAGAGLVAGISFLPSCSSDSRVRVEPRPAGDPGLWLKISSDNKTTVTISKSEMGQGITTATAMVLAEELCADWSQLQTKWAPADRAYGNPLLGGLQVTAASTSIRTLWKPLRQAGAILREMLVETASDVWGVAKEECRAKKSFITHVPTGRKLSYGRLAAATAKRPFPRDVSLKNSDEFQIIGQPIPGIDAREKITGKPVFGFDVGMPDLLVAVVARCPVFGGIPAGFDASKAVKIKGVRDVIEISNGIAVVADRFWPAKLGRDALQITWDQGPNRDLDSKVIRSMLEEMVHTEGAVILERGDTAPLLSSERRIESVYTLPYLAHAPMEPLSCTARVTSKSCDIWGPIQNLTRAQDVAVSLTDLPRSAVKVHLTFLGCAFGRASISDHVAEAVEISKAVGRPVKVLWTREDDIQHDYYHPATTHRLSASLGENGLPAFWFHRIAGISDLDITLTRGARGLPFDIKNVRVECVKKRRGKLRNLRRYVQNLMEGRHTYNGMWNSRRTSIPYVPTGPWRSVGHYHNSFVIESFVDELAVAAGKDPYLYRRRLLRNAPRDLAVLELAASKFGWGKPLKQGRHVGIAQHNMEDTRVAHVVEISIEKGERVKVHRVVCAIDCGIVVNPDTVVAQMEGGTVFGLTATLKGKITLTNGGVDQSNFHDYPMLTMSETPRIEVHIVPSREPPTGVGETAVPTVAPAVANAVFSAIGRRIRTLPITLPTG